MFARMGYSTWPNAPGWTADLRSMLAAYDDQSYGVTVRARCRTCRKWQDFTRRDLERIADQRGMAFSLFNKRTRCRLTTGCHGWNIFGWSNGTWVYPLYSEQQDERWAAHDAERDRALREYAARLVRGGEADRARKAWSRR